jgi:DNA processing protein
MVDILDIALSSILFLSLKEKVLVRKELDSEGDFAVLSSERLSSIIGREVRSKNWTGESALRTAEKSAAIMERLSDGRFGIRSCRYDDASYPPLLREMTDPPYMVFYRGSMDCLLNPCVSVVGTRRVCRECAQATFDFASDAARDGLTVVSGLAYGVDSFAHKGAVSVDGGKSAAVLPCGIDSVVPGGHRKLAEKILSSGGILLSEYLPGVSSEPWRFVQRNRIIAGLSRCVLVTQAPPGSGALITVDFALGYGRDVVFHEAGLCDEAKRLSESSALALRVKGGKSAEAKLRNSFEEYVKSGAPLISGYEDFKRFQDEAPGTHKIKTVQLDLFDLAVND